MENAPIINLLSRILEVQEKILMRMEERDKVKGGASVKNDLAQDLADRVDVKSILKISESTLFRITKNNSVKSVRIGRRIYYSLSEIKKVMGD